MLQSCVVGFQTFFLLPSADFAKEENVKPNGRPPPRRQVQYADAARLVGLDPNYASFRHFPVFRLNQSRIPTGLLKSIVQEMDVLQFQYDPIPDPDEYNACEPFSRMLSPVSFGFFGILHALEYSELTVHPRFSVASQVVLVVFSKPR